MSDPRYDQGPPPSGTSWFYDPKVRAVAFQILVVAVVFAIGYEVVMNAKANLQRQNIASGFGFLSNRAGFDISQTLIAYTTDSTYGRAFLVGLLNTLLVAALGIVCATILGFLVGIGRLSHNWLVRTAATSFVELVRNVPLLLQLFFWYFAVVKTLPQPRQSIELVYDVFINNRGLYAPRPIWEAGSDFVGIALVIGVIATFVMRSWAAKRQATTGQQFPVGWGTLGLVIGLPLVVFFATGMPISFEPPVLKGFNFQGGVAVLPEFVALLLGLSIYTSSFIAEIVRAGILAVPKGQTEAASALGLPRDRTLRLVIIPQAMRVIIPPLTSQYLNLTKNSSLAVAIGYPDLVSVFAGTVLNQTNQAVEVIVITMLVYLTISLLTAAFMNWFNARVALVER
ncbi:amino acid ABC transporter permease [Segnochrobactraceae bacterium EtOH-i3]